MPEFKVYVQIQIKGGPRSSLEADMYTKDSSDKYESNTVGSFCSKAGLHNEVVSTRSKSPSGNNSWEKSTANRRAYFSHALISIKVNGQKLFLSPVTNPEPKHLLCFTVSLMLLKLHMLQSRFCPWGHWETKSPVNKKGNNLFTLNEMG